MTGLSKNVLKIKNALEQAGIPFIDGEKSAKQAFRLRIESPLSNACWATTRIAGAQCREGVVRSFLRRRQRVAPLA